jgi:hypothetical protein
MYFYKYGYARVEAVDATHLDWQWVEGASGTVYDHVSITQSADWNSQPWTLSVNGVPNSQTPTTAPSVAPTGPTLAPTIPPTPLTITFSQSIGGITSEQASQLNFKYVFTSAIAGILNVPLASVLITASTDISTSVMITYTVKVPAGQSSFKYTQTALLSVNCQTQIMESLNYANQGYTHINTNVCIYTCIYIYLSFLCIYIHKVSGHFC